MSSHLICALQTELPRGDGPHPTLLSGYLAVLVPGDSLYEEAFSSKGHNT